MPSSHRGLTFRALILFVLIDIGFNVAGFDPVYRRIIRHRRHRRTDAAAAFDPERIEATLTAVLQATRWYYRTRLDCLPKALTLFFLLRQQAIPAEFCLGVKRFPFAGHAWVEVNGIVVDNKPKQVRAYRVVDRRA